MFKKKSVFIVLTGTSIKNVVNGKGIVRGVFKKESEARRQLTIRGWTCRFEAVKDIYLDVKRISLVWRQDGQYAAIIERDVG